MSRKRFTEEFKIEAVRQITERGFAARDVAERLGVSPNSLYVWIKQCWIQSGSVYGYRKISDDLRDMGETCGEQRVYRLMKAEGLRSQLALPCRRA